MGLRLKPADKFGDLGPAGGETCRHLRDGARGLRGACKLGRGEHFAMEFHPALGVLFGQFERCLQKRLQALDTDSRGLAQFAAQDGQTGARCIDGIVVALRLVKDRTERHIGQRYGPRIAQCDLFRFQGEAQPLLRGLDIAVAQLDVGKQRVCKRDPPVGYVLDLADKCPNKMGGHFCVARLAHLQADTGLYVEPVCKFDHDAVKLLFCRRVG